MSEYVAGICRACTTTTHIRPHAACLHGRQKGRDVKKNSHDGQTQNQSTVGLCHYKFRTLNFGCQFDLPHVPRRVVVSKYIPRRAHDIVVDLSV
jgi:hypothetical protein